MDSAYDHIQEENFPKDPDTPTQASLNTEFQEAYQAVANSPWGATLGGLWGTVKKASEPYLEEAQKLNTTATTTASKGWTDLVSRTRSLSLLQPDQATETEDSAATEAGAEAPKEEHPDRPESLPKDIVKEAQSIVSRFREEAAKRLKDIEKAEDAADEALLKLGSNIKSFLKDAVSIAPPVEFVDESQPNKILFESKDSDGKRIIHTNRLDAQLHVIHSSLDSFLKDPAGPEYDAWTKEFNVNSRTETISADLEKHEELRKAMEALVPERVDYATFWCRYYFLKRVAELEEQRRKELLQGAVSNANEEGVAWDEDSDEEDTSTPNASRSTPTLPKGDKPLPISSNLKPSDVLSQPDSDASYDLVSGAASRAGGSPREIKRIEESDEEEDWE
ncbi:BSD-domain-containing protein [Microthyrium microscopicum]|uniref:BSD-domain-containing protein n=1 Tax=Microthyrium microscopicum TaxID=703497 RepID=A0A6A6UDP1_9PEZI|nr:BSD-domain-containing protein [Microthyrium microscopicum]